MREKTVLLQGAMEEECACFLKHMKEPEETVIDGWHFWSGELCGRPVVVARTFIGMVNAAVSTVLGIRHFSPGAIINQGIAGAHGLDLEIGDIVLGTRVMNGASFQSEKLDRGQGSRWEGWKPLPLEIRGELTQDNTFLSDPGLIAAARKAAANGNFHVVEGCISSADMWNREYDRIAFSHAAYGSMAEEMEGAAVCQVAAGYNIPVLSVRVISNNERKDGTYAPETADICAQFVMEILAEYGRI